MSIFNTEGLTYSELPTINNAKMNPVYTVMHKDIPLFDVDEEACSISVRTENAAYMPLALIKKNLTMEDYRRWAEKRVLVLDRKNSKLLCNALGLDQDDKYSIARACRLLSLDDCFWIREDKGELWDEYNLRNNSLSKAVQRIALDGETISITGNIYTPEFTVNGTFPKCWKHEADGMYLCKKSLDGFESEKEVLVSDMLDILGIDHVRYSGEDTLSGYVCRCRCMSDEDRSRVNYNEWALYMQNNGKSPTSAVLGVYSRYFGGMVITDYLTNNQDRHGGNWGFYRDNYTGAITGPHPLFDHNLCFNPSWNDDERYTPLPNYRTRELALQAQAVLKYNVEDLWNIPEHRFTDIGIDYGRVSGRIKELSVKVPIQGQEQDVPSDDRECL